VVAGPYWQIIMVLAPLSEALRNRRTPSSRETEDALYKRRYIELFQNIEHSLGVLCSDFSSALATEIDEVQTYHSHFKSGLRRAFGQVLRRAVQSEQPVVMFHEVLPGYTLMLFKKTGESTNGAAPFSTGSSSSNGAAPPPPPALRSRRKKETPAALPPAISDEDAESPSVEWQAVSKVIDCYFQRTGNRVLAIETEDALLTFFPVSDMKRNLREMGYVGFKED
jgi:hypothetical protein